LGDLDLDSASALDARSSHRKGSKKDPASRRGSKVPLGSVSRRGSHSSRIQLIDSYEDADEFEEDRVHDNRVILAERFLPIPIGKGQQSQITIPLRSVLKSVTSTESSLIDPSLLEARRESPSRERRGSGNSRGSAGSRRGSRRGSKEVRVRVRVRNDSDHSVINANSNLNSDMNPNPLTLTMTLIYP
jgi:hypothetical protein